MLDLVTIAIGCVLAADALYLLLLAVAALWSRDGRPFRTPSSHLVILVPAYNEADYIKRCVDSLSGQDYPSERYSIVVIADNCTDATATIAAAAGAEVLQRHAPDSRGKGQALRWAMDQVISRSPAPDAIVVVDADSIAEPQLLGSLAARLETGAEDLEYSIGLRLAGVRPVFAPDARLRGPVPTGGRALRSQQQRWTGGRFYIVRTQLPRLAWAMLRRRDWSLLDALVDLATPPLGLLAAGVTGGTVIAFGLAAGGLIAWWPLVPWTVALVALPAFVLVGFRAARCPASMYRSLVAAPLIVASQLLGYLPLLKGLRPSSWERTERPSEAATSADQDARRA